VAMRITRGPRKQKGPPERASYLAPEPASDQPTEKDVPQPQVEVALGLRTWK
jgi:hypothetical protein